MKKNFLISLLGLLVAVGFATARSSGPHLDVTRTSVNEGNTRVGISVTCVSTAWTSLLSARAVRRSAILQTLPTASNMVCLGTNTSENVCADTSLGVELNTADTYTEYNEAALYCRSKLANVIVKGFDQYDSGD